MTAYSTLAVCNIFVAGINKLTASGGGGGGGTFFLICCLLSWESNSSCVETSLCDEIEYHTCTVISFIFLVFFAFWTCGGGGGAPCHALIVYDGTVVLHLQISCFKFLCEWDVFKCDHAVLHLELFWRHLSLSLSLSVFHALLTRLLRT